MTSNNKNQLWIGGIVGFLIGISGNLIAAWIQQDVLSNSFTPLRISLIILCALIGIVSTVFLESIKNPLPLKDKAINVKGKNIYYRVRLIWSKLKTRGKGIHIEDVSSIGSDIDIDTK